MRVKRADGRVPRLMRASVTGLGESRGLAKANPLTPGTPPSPHAPRLGGSRSLSAPSTLAGDLLLYGVGARDRHLMGFAKDRSAQSTECVVDATSRMAA